MIPIPLRHTPGTVKHYRIIELMARIDLHFKVEADLNEDEDPKKFASEICRQIAKVYGVRRAELTSLFTIGNDE